MLVGDPASNVAAVALIRAAIMDDKESGVLILSQNGLLHDLCVPKTSSRSCDQAVLVDQASGVGLPSDAVPAEIDRFGQGFQRRSGVQ